MLSLLRQNKEKLRSAVQSAVLNQCKEILGDTVKYQIEGLIGITEVDTDEVILLKVLHNLTKSETSEVCPPVDSIAVPDLKLETAEKQKTENMGNMEGQMSDLMNGTDNDSQPKFSETLFGEGSYEFSMRQDLGGETLSLSVESFQDSFTDINMSTSESSESLSDATKHTEDECDFKSSCDNEHDLNNGCGRSLQTPDPHEQMAMEEVTIKMEKPTEMEMPTPLKFTQELQKNGNKVQRHKSKVKQFPERYQEQRQRDAERMRMRRRLRQSQMTEEERQRQRERWRDKKRKQRLKRKLTRDSKSESCNEQSKDGIKASQSDKNAEPIHALSIGPPGTANGDVINQENGCSPSKGPIATVSDSPNLNLQEKPQVAQCASDTSSTHISKVGTPGNVALHGQSPKPQDSVVSPLNWQASSPGLITCSQKPILHNPGSASNTWHRDPASSCLPLNQPLNMNPIGQIRPAFSSSQLNPQPLFDLTRDDYHIRHQFNVHSTLQGSHRPLSHGPPMSYTSTGGQSYPAFSIPYMNTRNTQSSFNPTGFKPPYIKAEPGLGEQPCCGLSGPGPQMNPYVSYKHFNNNPGIHAWDQNNTMPNLDVALIKQEPVSAYNNWL